MPQVSGTTVCRAAPVAVWRLVHDPARLHEWMADTERVEPGESGDVTRYLHGWPDFPMPTRVSSSAAGGRVTISCLVSDIDFEVSLAPHPDGCLVAVAARLPEVEAHRRDGLQKVIDASLVRLAEVAAAPPPALG